MSDFYLYILKKYIFIPLLVLCIPILWGPALQCGDTCIVMQFLLENGLFGRVAHTYSIVHFLRKW